MKQRRPIVIYPEYFDFNLKRSQGRKVPLNQSVKKATINEILTVVKPLANNIENSSKSNSGNWSSNYGSIIVDYEGIKMSLLHKIGTGLKKLRKTN